MEPLIQAQAWGHFAPQSRDSPLKKATSSLFRRNAEIPKPEVLTHKAICENVPSHI